MRRRDVLTCFGGAAVAASMTWAAHAQQPRRVGVLMSLTKDDTEDQARAAAFEDGMKALGWVDGRNLRLEYRWYAGEVAHARTLSRELIEARSEVIMAAATPGALAARQETQIIPIVFVTVSDPVGLGLAESLTRPGGNATGITYFEASVGGKFLQVLRQIAPAVKRVAVLYNPQTSVYALYLNATQSAASSLGVDHVPAPVRDPSEIEAQVAALVNGGAGGGLICLPDAYLNVHRAQIIALAARHKLPAVYPTRLFPVDGGLISYGVDTPDIYRRAAPFVDRILKGASPAVLPVQQPAKYEMVLNLKAAKAQGIEVPLAMQATADEVIE